CRLRRPDSHRRRYRSVPPGFSFVSRKRKPPLRVGAGAWFLGVLLLGSGPSAGSRSLREADKYDGNKERGGRTGHLEIVGTGKSLRHEPAPPKSTPELGRRG